MLAGAPALAQGGLPELPAVPALDGAPAPSPAPGPTVQPTAIARAQLPAQPPKMGGQGGRDEVPEYRVPLEPPGPERLFKLQSEDRLKEQMRQESRHVGGVDRIFFPEEPALSSERFPGRHWPALRDEAEPNYVVYRRQYFEQINSERYGWELGILQPFLCAGQFYLDVALLPYHAGTEPFRKYESNAGYCLPGDPVPYLLYPPDINLTGLAAEAAAVTGIRLAFP